MLNRQRAIDAIRCWISDRRVYLSEQYLADLEALRQRAEDASVVEGTITYGESNQENDLKLLEGKEVE